MAAGDLIITYGATSVTFDQFSGDDLPRAYLGQASLEFSALGTGYGTGPAKRQRRIWSIAAYVTSTQITNLFTIFEAWDTARATGTNTAEVDIQDELLGAVVLAKGFFTDPPTISKLGPGNNTLFLVTFALTEP